MKKPKFKIGDSIVVERKGSYYLVEIVKGMTYSDNEGVEWFYWTSLSGEMNSLGWVKERDIMAFPSDK